MPEESENAVQGEGDAEGEADGGETADMRPKGDRGGEGKTKQRGRKRQGVLNDRFHASQPDPKLRTIHGVLFDAKVGAVSHDNSDNLMKPHAVVYKWQVQVKLGRAARTDAGVHAAGNVVSMMLITVIPAVPDLVARINEELPPDYGPSTCDSHKYTYFSPCYLMIPPKPGTGLHSTLKEQSAERPSHPSGRTDQRWSRTQLAALRETTKKFDRSHNFHNFTIGRDFRHRSCNRSLKSIEELTLPQILDPAVYGDSEWTAVLLHGQTFMLHQNGVRTPIVTLALEDAL
ncbi:pseudouridine synthase [Earliella scabrosa]|nr:pseudouridine synthase [Earliella scabrosa]